MKLLLPFVAVLFAACSTPAPSPSAAPASGAGAAGNVRYRYTNTLNLGNDLTMDQVSVIGYDEDGQGEANRLEVTVNSARLTLRSINQGNALYTPAVTTGPNGTLVVSWGEIDDGGCRVTIAQKADGSLSIVSRKELDYAAGRR